MLYGIVRVLAILVFLYLIWRDLKDDYRSEDLINFGWLGVFWFLVGARASYGVLNWGVWNVNWWDWLAIWTRSGSNYLGGYLTLMLFVLWYCKKRGWKALAFLEDGINAFLWLLILLNTDDLLRGRWNLAVFIKIIVFLICLLVVKLLKKKYRSFLWYKSGKKGFLFWVMNAIIMVLFSVVGLVLKFRFLSTIIYMIGAVISIFQLLILGEIWKRK